MTELELYQAAREARKDPVILNDKTKTAVNIFLRERSLFVAARETTSNWKDWAFNILFFKTFGYHTGFLIKAKSVYLQVLKEIGSYDKNTYDTIVFTGYSQGGAVASIFFERFLRKNLTKKKIIGHTFASPRVFSIWKAFVLRKRLKVIQRFYINTDLVPRVPFFIMGFLHVGSPIKMKYELELKKFGDIFSSHYPGTYRDGLREL